MCIICFRKYHHKFGKFTLIVIVLCTLIPNLLLCGYYTSVWLSVSSTPVPAKPIPVRGQDEVAPVGTFSDESSDLVLVNTTHSVHTHTPANLLHDEGKWSWKPGSSPKNCAPYPQNNELKFSNTHWQLVNSKGADNDNGSLTIWLFNAYYDNRIHAMDPPHKAPIVRVLGVSNRVLEVYVKKSKDAEIWCQLWIPGEDSAVIVKAIEFASVWAKNFGSYHDGVMLPYLFTCPLPTEEKNEPLQPPPPVAVSIIVGDNCSKATNKLRVIYNQRQPLPNQPPSLSPPPRFAVCVKGLSFAGGEYANNDNERHIAGTFKDAGMATRLIEWLELLRIMGVEKVYVYELDTHPQIKAVLEYYQNDGVGGGGGFVDVAGLTLPGAFPNDPIKRRNWMKAQLQKKRQQELVPYNDCLYRNLYRYDWISLLDVDEIIIPAGGNTSTWQELMTQLETYKDSKVTYYAIGWTGCFFYGDDLQIPFAPDIPAENFMLRHVYQFYSIYGLNFKSIKGLYNTNQTISVFNHWPGPVGSKHAHTVQDRNGFGHLHHYKYWNRHCGGTIHKPPKDVKCTELKCFKYEVNEMMLKYKNELIGAVAKVVQKLQLGTHTTHTI